MALNGHFPRPAQTDPYSDWEVPLGTIGTPNCCLGQRPFGVFFFRKFIQIAGPSVQTPSLGSGPVSNAAIHGQCPEEAPSHVARVLMLATSTQSSTHDVPEPSDLRVYKAMSGDEEVNSVESSKDRGLARNKDKGELRSHEIP